MPATNGTNEIATIYNGSNEIEKVYKGVDLVYTSEPDPIPFIFTHTILVEGDKISKFSISPTTYEYDFDIDWGDGTIETHTTSSLTDLTSISHTYVDATTYTITISRKWANIIFTDFWKIESIVQWGNGWETLEGVFAELNLGTVTGETRTYMSFPIFPENKKVLSASKMFNSKLSSSSKALSIPNGFFKNLTRCVNFSECFCAVRDKSISLTNYLKIDGQIFPDCAGDLSACFAGCNLIDIENKIPEDLLYNITGVTTMKNIFSASNTYEHSFEYILPTRWFPKNLSNCLNFNNLFTIESTYDAEGKGYVDRITGTMENIWNRSDINANAEKSFSMCNLGSVSNYDSGIPISWGALLEETPTVTSSSGAFDSTIVPGQTTVSLSTKEGYTTLYGLIDTGTGINNGVVQNISYYDTMLTYSEPILIPEGATYFTIHYAYKRNSDGKYSWVEWQNVNISTTTTE